MGNQWRRIEQGGKGGGGGGGGGGGKGRQPLEKAGASCAPIVQGCPIRHAPRNRDRDVCVCVCGLAFGKATRHLSSVL
jgi:hypothetical protein